MAAIQQVSINSIPATKSLETPCYRNVEKGICRVCLGSSLMTVNIFNCSSKLGIPIADLIIQVTGCKVSRGDFFSQTICPPCLQDVQECYLLELELHHITIYQLEIQRRQEQKSQNIKELKIDAFRDQVKSEPSSSESESKSESFESDEKPENKPLEYNDKMIKNELDFKCPCSPETFSIPTIEQLYQCFRCQASFVRKKQFHKHIRGKHLYRRKVWVFQCPKCPKIFLRKFPFVSHLVTHSGERSFRCVICPKAFIRKRSLINHIYLHFGELPYKCSHCRKTFYRLSRLKRHWAHPLNKCSQFKKFFAQGKEFPTPIRSYTGVQLFDCPNIEVKIEDNIKQEEFQDIRYDFLEGQEEEFQDIKYDLRGVLKEELQDVKYDFVGGQEDSLQNIKYEFHGGQDQEELPDIKYDFHGGQEKPLPDIKYDFRGGQGEVLQDIKYDFRGGQVKEEIIQDENNFNKSWTRWNVNNRSEKKIKPTQNHNRSTVHYLSSRYYY